VTAELDHATYNSERTDCESRTMCKMFRILFFACTRLFRWRLVCLGRSCKHTAEYAAICQNMWQCIYCQMKRIYKRPGPHARSSPACRMGGRAIQIAAIAWAQSQSHHICARGDPQPANSKHIHLIFRLRFPCLLLTGTPSAPGARPTRRPSPPGYAHA